MVKIYIETGYGLEVRTCKEADIEKVVKFIESKGMTCSIKRD